MRNDSLSKETKYYHTIILLILLIGIQALRDLINAYLPMIEQNRLLVSKKRAPFDHCVAVATIPT